MKRAVTMDFMDQLQTNGRAMALMTAGEHKRASEIYVEITTRWPNYIGAHMVGAASSLWAGIKLFYDGLRKAGMPEGLEGLSPR